MKTTFFTILLIIGLISCYPERNRIQVLEKRIDSLQKRIESAYKPGFGEFMSGIQVHHAKLWYAGINQNWDLADFEIHEIKELRDGITKYETERKESQEIVMLDQALDSVNYAIRNKDPAIFKNSFIFLTNTCNNCHQVVNYKFNDVKIPDTPPFSNQVFNAQK